ncbi:MAG: class IV adenylate cyclase [Dissulfuribacterales bacterium]
MPPLEIEVKFYLTDINPLRERLLSLGANLNNNSFEKNIRFENQKNSLHHEKSLLRLRKSDKTTLTFKSEPPEPHKQQNEFKILHELEVSVDDFATMQQILESIGFHPEQIYEKKRETYVLGQTEICIDTMPFANFIEIEGRKEEIRKTADLLKLDWENRILCNYLEIFEALKQKLKLTFTDITFDNFKDIDVDFDKYHHLFVAG